MKQCPQCNRTYADETLNFCLDDGVLLSTLYDPEATLVMPSPHSVPPTIEALPHKQSDPQIKGHSHNLNFSYIIILLLAVLLTGSAVALFYEKGKESSTSNAKQSESQTPISNQIKSEQATVNSATPIIQQNKNQVRFSVTPCNSIKDTQSGLEWFVGPDRNVTWYEAQQWTVVLANCGGSWRMPTIEEIRTLYNPALKAGTGYYTSGKYFPAHIDPVFDAIGGGSWVWANEKIGDEALSFNLNQGKTVTYSAMNTFYSTRAFAVRNVRN
ncbi:MAG: DUF1566 domain-containing protein [Pyrinomonadaceae bacterium]